MVVGEDGYSVGSIGGGNLERMMKKEALSALKDGKVRVFDSELDDIDMHCGGSVTVVIQPMGVQKRAVIFGAGHVGLQIAKALAFIGIGCKVVAPEVPEHSDEGLIHFVDTQHFDLEREIDGRTFVVIATSTHDTDAYWLKRVIDKRPFYIGMVSSIKKRERIFEQLVKHGVDRAVLDRVRAPVGLDIGAVTPQEIAVSVAAEVIKFMRKGGQSWSNSSDQRP